VPADPVSVAYVHDVEVAYSWHQSLMLMLMHDAANEQRLVRGGYVAVRYGTGGIAEARNKVVEQFLESSHPWLWWVDTDMGFAPDTIDRLIAVADKKDRPVIGGLCFAQREVRLDGMGGFVTIPTPTIFDWKTDVVGKSGFVSRMEYQRNALVQAAGTGSACILIHRSVFEKMDAGDWYKPMANGDTVLSEDLSFCVRLAQLDIPLWIDTSVRTSHLKPIWLSEGVADVYSYYARSHDNVGDAPAVQGSRAERRRKARSGK
jgi:hypothetical protein